MRAVAIVALGAAGCFSPAQTCELASGTCESAPAGDGGIDPIDCSDWDGEPGSPAEGNQGSGGGGGGLGLVVLSSQTPPEIEGAVSPGTQIKQ